MDFQDIISRITKVGVAGQSGDKDGHDFRGNQWTVMGPWGQPVPRPRDPATNKPLKGQALADELKRLYPSPTTPIPKTSTTAKPAPPKISGTAKAPKTAPAPISAPSPTPTPPTPQPAPQPVVTPPTPPPAVQQAPEPEKVEEPKAEEKPETPKGEKHYATWGNKPIDVRCADAEKWKPHGELEEAAAKAAGDFAKRLYVPKERRALFAMNLTKILTNPEEFRKYDKAAMDIQSGSSQHAGAAMLAMIGYTGLPHVVDEATFRATPGTVTFSGIQSTRSSSQNVQQKLATMYAGPLPRYGHWMFGVAFYTSTDKGTTSSYSGGGGTSQNVIFRNKLIDENNVYRSRNGQMLQSDILVADAREDHRVGPLEHPDYKFGEIMTDAGYTETEKHLLSSILFGNSNNTTKSITPALAGYDAYHDVPHNYTMVLNRGAMVLPDTYIAKVSGTSSFDADGARGNAIDVPVDVAHIVVAQNMRDESGDTETVTKGDVPGHVFHGNQYEDGEGGGGPKQPPPFGSKEEKTAVVDALAPEVSVTKEAIGQAYKAMLPYLKAAREAEPAISSVIRNVATISGGQQVRAESANKSSKSTTEKTIKDTISAYGQIKPALLSKSASHLHDLVRYTITWDAKHMAEGAQRAIDELRSNGFEPFVNRGQPYIKNYFHNEPGNSYRGINCNFVDPKTGLVFEVQFHTPQSLDTAERMHIIYDEVRKMDPNSPRYEELQEKMRAEFAKVQIPEGIEKVGRMTFKKARFF